MFLLKMERRLREERNCSWSRGCRVLLRLAIWMNLCGVSLQASLTEHSSMCTYGGQKYGVGVVWTINCNRTECSCQKSGRTSSPVVKCETLIPCPALKCNRTQVLVDELDNCGCSSCVNGFACSDSTGQKHVLETDRPSILVASLVDNTVSGNFTAIPCLKGNYSVKQYKVKFILPNGTVSSVSISQQSPQDRIVSFSHRMTVLVPDDIGIEVVVSALSEQRTVKSDGVNVFRSLATSPSPLGSTSATDLTTPTVTNDTLWFSEPPVPSPVTTVQEGDTVVLACPVQESETAEVVWLHQETSYVHKQATVMLSKVRQVQAGHYTCQVTTVSGQLQQSASIRLDVEETSGGTATTTSPNNSKASTCSSDSNTAIVIGVIVVCVFVTVAVILVTVWTYRRQMRQMERLSAINKPHKKISADTSVTFSNSSVSSPLTLTSELSSRTGGSYTMRAPEPLPRVDSQQSMASDVFLPPPSAHVKPTGEPIYESGEVYVDPDEPPDCAKAADQSKSNGGKVTKDSTNLPLPASQVYSYTDRASAMRSTSVGSVKDGESQVKSLKVLVHVPSEYIDVNETPANDTKPQDMTQREENDYILPADQNANKRTDQKVDQSHPGSSSSPTVVIQHSGSPHDVYQTPIDAAQDSTYKDPIDVRRDDSPYEEPADTLRRSVSNGNAVHSSVHLMRRDRAHTVPDAVSGCKETDGGGEYAMPLDSFLKPAGSERRASPSPQPKPSPRRVPLATAPKAFETGSKPSSGIDK